MDDNKLHQDQQDIAPFELDELRVLEALVKLEEKYGQTILSDDQRERVAQLSKSRGEGGGDEAEARASSTSIDEEDLLKQKRVRTVNLIVDVLRGVVQKDGNKVDFEDAFGVTPEQMKLEMIRKYTD